MERITWHTAFQEAIKLELEEYQDVLTFETEHQLTTEPLKIDVLIIKKRKDIVIKKNIARIFQTNNVIEYKSPHTSVSVSDYDKVQCYSRLYAAINKIDTAEMSVTIVSVKRPRKLLRYLSQRFSVKSPQSGIYAVAGDTSSTQVIVSDELSADENLWLNSLRDDLERGRLEKVFTESDRYKLKINVAAYLYVLAEANPEQFKENIMGKNLDTLMNRWIARGREFGLAEGLAEGEARGEARGEVKSIMAVLKARFKRIPSPIVKTLNQYTDSIALESLVAHAVTCSSLDEFAADLK